MTFSIIKFILFVFSIATFGFIFLSQINKIKSLILLIPFSVSFGVASYLFLFHILAFGIGPQNASLVALFLLILISIIIVLIKNKNLEKIDPEITKKQYLILFIVLLCIFIPTFLTYMDFGNGEKSIQYPTLLTIFHNNTYPPKDFYKPEYYLLYHYISTMLPGSIYYLCKLPISYSFALIGTILFAASFLGTFAFVWIITKNYKSSLIITIFNYFAGGLLWIDAILRYLTKNLPLFAENWGFLETFCYLGLHGGMTGATSVGPISMASIVGSPLTGFCIFLIYFLLVEKELKRAICHLIVLCISLFILLITEESLIIAIAAGLFFYSFFLLTKKKWRELIIFIILFLTLFMLYKTFGLKSFINYSDIQDIGRLTLYDVKPKDKPLEILSYRRLNVDINSGQPVSIFSWDFICEFPFLIALPFIFIYVLKVKTPLVTIPFLGASSTFFIPIFLECTLSPPLLTRFFGFFKGFLTLLSLLAMWTLIKNIKFRKLIFYGYAISMCISPLLQFTTQTLFTPNIYINPQFIEKAIPLLKKGDFKKYFEFAKDYTLEPFWRYKEEKYFLSKNSKPNEVAISNFYQLPAYAGIYTVIPPNAYFVKDINYSRSDNTYQVIFATMDPHLINELNLKWIVIDKDFKKFLNKEALNFLNNKKLCKLVYKKQNKLTKEITEIYYIKDLNDYLTNFKRKTAWLLTTNKGHPIEPLLLNNKNITLFSTSKEAIIHLKSIYLKYPELKKYFIISKVVPIEELEKQIKDTNLNISLVRKF